jgi:hypothetical protein
MISEVIEFLNAFPILEALPFVFAIWYVFDKWPAILKLIKSIL